MYLVSESTFHTTNANAGVVRIYDINNNLVTSTKGWL